MGDLIKINNNNNNNLYWGPFFGPTGSSVRFLIGRYLGNPFSKCATL